MNSSIRAETVLRETLPGQFMLPLYCGQRNSTKFASTKDIHIVYIPYSSPSRLTRVFSELDWVIKIEVRTQKQGGKLREYLRAIDTEEVYLR